MSRIADHSIDEVREAVDMLDLVGTATQVKRSGATYMATCPFHQEKSASFSIDPAKKLYHCFGCQRGGDHVKFVQELQNLDFVGAIEWLEQALARRDRAVIVASHDRAFLDAVVQRIWELRDRHLRVFRGNSIVKNFAGRGGARSGGIDIVL